MKAFELKALLSRIDPNAEVLVTTADPKGHGSFANSVSYVFQDRSVMDGMVGRPVLVLGNSPVGRVWAAKGHGEPSAMTACTMRARHHGGEVGTIMVRSSMSPDGSPDRVLWFEKAWGQSGLDLWTGPEAGWTEVVFQSENEARAFADRVTGLAVVELVAR